LEILKPFFGHKHNKLVKQTNAPKNKRVRKQLKRFIKHRRIVRRWRLWARFCRKKSPKQTVHFWRRSGVRIKRTYKLQFLHSNLARRANTLRRRPRRRFSLRFTAKRRWRRTLGRNKLFRKDALYRATLLYKILRKKALLGKLPYRGTFRKKLRLLKLRLKESPRKRVRRAIGKRFVRSKYKPFGKRAWTLAFRGRRKRRKFFKKFRFSRRRRDYTRYVKYYSRARVFLSKFPRRSVRKLLKPTFYLSRRLKATSRVDRLYRLNLQRPLTKRKMRALPRWQYVKPLRLKVRASHKIRHQSPFPYTLIWQPRKFNLYNSTYCKFSSEPLNILRNPSLVAKHSQVNHYESVFRTPQAFFSIIPTLLDTSSTNTEFLKKVQANLTILLSYHRAKSQSFQSTRLAALRPANNLKLSTAVIYEDSLSKMSKDSEDLELYERTPLGNQGTRPRILKPTPFPYKRYKPRRRGRKPNSRFQRSYNTLPPVTTRNRFNFLQKYTYVSNLNRAFIRILRVKITYYRLTTREFFSQYLIRLNPRHVFGTTVNYKNYFKVLFSRKVFERFDFSSEPVPSLPRLNYYVQRKWAASHLSIGSSDFNMLGLFNFVSLLQDYYPFEGYYNRTRRKRRLVRRRWQFRKLFFGKLMIRKTKREFIQTNSRIRSTFTSAQRSCIKGSKTTLLNDLDTFRRLLTQPKYILNYLSFSFQQPHRRDSFHQQRSLALHFADEEGRTFFNDRVNRYNTSNIVPKEHFSFHIKRKLLKLFKFHKFSQNVVMWYYNMLIRFMEFCSGKKVYIKFNPFLENYLSFSDLARCSVWTTRVRSFQRILGPKIFLDESLKVLCLSLRYKDPTLLSNWMRGMLYRMSFWKYRLLFRYLKFLLRYLFFPYFRELGFKGLKLRLKGKISVAGNARTRTLRYAIGETSYSQFNHRVVSDFSTLNTFTGVLGFRIWLFF